MKYFLIYVAVMIVMAASISSCTSNVHGQYTKCGSKAAKAKMNHYYSLQHR